MCGRGSPASEFAAVDADNARMRVTMFDSLRKSVAEHAANLRDARMSDAEQASCRPGFRYDAFDAAAEKEAVRDAYIADLTNSWRNPTRDTAGVYRHSAAAEGTACTIDGAPGTLVRQGNSLVCRPTKRTDAMTMDEIYEKYSRAVGNAWRTP